ncbi:MAG: hypothetical protein PHF35_03310 [Candidatus Moranbacteria bacterium]|nr:hypothetical protein [Candidatus Moranbacteria bacterium]
MSIQKALRIVAVLFILEPLGGLEPPTYSFIYTSISSNLYED